MVHAGTGAVDGAETVQYALDGAHSSTTVSRSDAGGGRAEFSPKYEDDHFSAPTELEGDVNHHHGEGHRMPHFVQVKHSNDALHNNAPRPGPPHLKSMPGSCTCRRDKWGHGICHYFTDESLGYCAKRDCLPKFVCVAPSKHGITCILRKIADRIVSVGFHKCERRPASGFMYVPYTAS